jgi:glutamate formiminotransferase/formiminotetrahydrofolate cyclodeaminase
MRKIVECIPNFSEGGRPSVIDQIIASITSVPSVVLLDRESDPDHNRSVVTFVADPEHVVDAAIAGARSAAELIDLNKHIGEHPRMGATDVIPFVPIAGVSMDDCVLLARQCGERMWKELGIPVYLYEKAAARPERENLATIRKGQFEGIRDEIASASARLPDFGEARVHPTAGITAVGARPALIAYNVNLGTSDIRIANKIARAARHQSGGLRYVKALGFELKDRGIVQVSMNMVNHEGTPLFRAFELVKREAERYGVPVIGSEIVGLVPQAALNPVTDYYLRLENFSENQILEHRLGASTGPATESSTGDQHVPLGLADSTGSFSELLAAGTPTPGGGSVSAYCGLLASALGQMMANLTVGKRKYAEAEPRIKSIQSRLAGLAKDLRSLIDEDAASFDAVLNAYRQPKDTDEQKTARARQIDQATHHAIDIPFRTAERALEVLRLLADLSEIGNPSALPDVATGGQMAKTAVKGAYYNISINTSALSDRDEAARIVNAIEQLVEQSKELAGRIELRLVGPPEK